MSRKALAVALGLAAILWLAAWAAAPWHGLWRTAAIDVLGSFIYFLAGGAAFVAARRPENEQCRRAFVLLGLGAFCNALGQTAWSGYELLGDGVPAPSLADAGYLLTLPLMAAGLLSWPRSRPAGREGALADAALFVGISFLFSFEFVLGPIVRNGVEGFGGLVLIAYPVGDALLFTVVLAGLALRSWEENGRLLVVAAGLLAMVASDTAFAIAGDAYSTGDLLDVGWVAGFTLLGVAALLPAGWGARLRLPGGVVPVVLVGVVAGVFLYNLGRESATLGRFDFAGQLLTVVLFVALALRYLTVAGARQREARRLEALGEELQHEYAVRQAALEASRTGVCLLDASRTAVFENSAWRRLLGSSADDVEGWADLLTDEAPVLRHWSDERYLCLSRERLATGETLFSVDDLTDQERQRATRDRFLAEVMGAQDLESRRIAELLHDDVVQRLTALGMRLELAARRGGDPALAELAPECGAIVGSIRQLLVELHPVVLESQGLSAAIGAAAGGLRSIGVEVSVTRFDLRLAPEIEQLAYRLVQEALANVLKHAQASRVDISLSAGRGSLRCQVSDDGRGCDPDSARSAVQRGALGLHLVRERIELAGGRFLLDSQPGAGTTFAFELPVTLGRSAHDVAEVAS